MSVRSPTAGTWSSSQWRPDNEFETDRRRVAGHRRLCAATRAQATRRADPRSRYTRRRGGPTPPATGTRETARYRPRVVGPQYALHPDRTAHRLALRARLPGVAWSAAVSVGHHLHHETAVIARSPLLHVVHCPHRHPLVEPARRGARRAHPDRRRIDWAGTLASPPRSLPASTV